MQLIKSPLANGFIVTVLGSGISKLIQVVCVFYLANLLTKEHFGSFSFVRNTLNTILVMCALNFSSLCTKFTAESLLSAQSFKRLVLLCAFTLIVCVFFGTILCLLSDELLFDIIGNNDILIYFRIIGLLLPVFVMQPLIEGILRGIKEFRLIGLLQIFTSITFCICIISGAIMNGMHGAIVGLLIYYFLYSAISIILILVKINKSKIHKENISGIQHELPILLSLIMPIFILSFIDAPINWWAQILIAKHDSYSAIGGMTAILQIRNLAILIPTYYLSTFASFASSLNAEHNYKDYFKKFEISELSMVFWCSLAGVLFVIFGMPMLGLYGDAYKTDYFAFVLSMLGFPLIVLANLYKVNLIIKEHAKYMLLISLLGSVFFILILYVLLIFDVDSVQSYFYGQLIQAFIMLIIGKIVLYKDKHV